MPDVFNPNTDLITRRSHYVAGVGCPRPSWRCVRWTIGAFVVSQCIVVIVFTGYTWHPHASSTKRTKTVDKSDQSQQLFSEVGKDERYEAVQSNRSHSVVTQASLGNSLTIITSHVTQKVYTHEKSTRKIKTKTSSSGSSQSHSREQLAKTNSISKNSSITKSVVKPNKHPVIQRNSSVFTSSPTRPSGLQRKSHETIDGRSKSQNTVKQTRTKSPSRPSKTLKITSNPSLSCSTYKSRQSYHTEMFCLQDDKKNYTVKFGPSVECLIEGTNIDATAAKKRFCVCKQGWSGMFCSKPLVATQSDLPSYYGLVLQKYPRRIIHALPFSMEFAMLETRLAMLNDVVDVFAILESNYTASGLPKARMLKDKLDAGWMRQYHSKIIYISLDYFPGEAKRDGWVIDALLRNYLSSQLFSGILHRLCSDDIFILTDADELPMRETLLFLKLHYGYPEPFGVRYTHNVFGFFWKEGVTDSYFGCTVAMLRYVFHNNAYFIRSVPTVMKKNEFDLTVYEKTGARIHSWMFGTEQKPAGWHCSWCFPPEGIKTKMDWSQLSDKPRWGNFLEKKDIKYISSLVKTGTWFDDETKFSRVFSTNENAAPPYILENEKRFSYLLDV